MNIQDKILKLLKGQSMPGLAIIKFIPEEMSQAVLSNLTALLISNKVYYDGHDYSLIPQRNKYGNVWTEVDGKKFQSKKEANRYSELMMCQKAGEISDLKCQVPYIVSDAVKWVGEGKTLSEIKYILDFEYKVVCEDGFRVVVEDVKGKATALYLLKRSLLLNRYPKIQFKET